MTRKRYGTWTTATKPVGTGGATEKAYGVAPHLQDKPTKSGKERKGRGATVERSPTLSIGAILRDARKAAGISQTALAKILGKSTSQVSRMETSSDNFPRITTLVSHLHTLNMRLAIEKPNGEFIILPISDFLWADGTPKTEGAKARRSK